MVVCLQMRFMEVAGDAQMLGAALNHSALNAANALGAWLGGVVIAAGLGYAAPGAVGAVLAALGLAVLGLVGGAAPPRPPRGRGGRVPRSADAGGRRPLSRAATPLQRCARSVRPAAVPT